MRPSLEAVWVGRGAGEDPLGSWGSPRHEAGSVHSIILGLLPSFPVKVKLHRAGAMCNLLSLLPSATSVCLAWLALNIRMCSAFFNLDFSASVMTSVPSLYLAVRDLACLTEYSVCLRALPHAFLFPNKTVELCTSFRSCLEPSFLREHFPGHCWLKQSPTTTPPLP